MGMAAAAAVQQPSTVQFTEIMLYVVAFRSLAYLLKVTEVEDEAAAEAAAAAAISAAAAAAATDAIAYSR